jgi:hypothetical protein
MDVPLGVVPGCLSFHLTFPHAVGIALLTGNHTRSGAPFQNAYLTLFPTFPTFTNFLSSLFAPAHNRLVMGLGRLHVHSFHGLSQIKSSAGSKHFITFTIRAATIGKKDFALTYYSH